MAAEFNLTFPDPEHVQVSLHDRGGSQMSAAQPFAAPLDARTRSDLTWYLETYPVHYTTELDDKRAAGIAAKLKECGAALFNSVLADHPARRLFDRFQDNREPGRTISISSLHPTVLAQPWELLCDPNGTFLFLETPSISIRRRLTDIGGRAPYRPIPKDSLHLLFVVSRPDDTGLIDPRADPLAVLDALDAEAPGRVTVEFLRPPTLSALVTRLNDARKPAVDILHFDGHGAYDPDGRMADSARRSLPTGVAEHLVREAPIPANHGYLLFEDDAHKSSLVAASVFGDLLQSKLVGLVILSACQSAMVDGEDALGSVAPRLIQAGIPSVLAMTQSVLVATTRALGGHFYRELAAGQTIGAALDAARRQLYFDPKRGERQRISGQVDLRLQDWFVPAVYQAGTDDALLKPATGETEPPLAPRHNLRASQETGFFGRTRELRDIERWFVSGTRRIVLTGFGGQGKTALAEEAGRWLLRTCLFDRVCFVGYAGFQGRDAVQVAVSTLAAVLAANLINAEAVKPALRATPTLLILDNLESLGPEARTELLSAAASWSEQGGSRVLVTARPDDLTHGNFPASGSLACRYLALTGLQPRDALDWFQVLLRLPPEPIVPVAGPDTLRALFGQVGFHPLSISVLALVLKQRRIADVAEGLAARLGQDGDPLLASLNLSLQRLDSEAQAILPGVGVFVDGAWEPMLTRVLDLDEARWWWLRDGLRQAGLLVLDDVSGVSGPFLRFHPALAPAMRAHLATAALERLEGRHREAYYQLSRVLYDQDSRNPGAARGIAIREMPNLLTAVTAGLERGEDNAVDFADSILSFLRAFGRTRDLAELQARTEAVAGRLGSKSWFLNKTNEGEQLCQQGKYTGAEAVFNVILRHVGDAPSYNRSNTLVLLARCHESQGRLEVAKTDLRVALQELGTLPTDRGVRRLQGTIHSDLGDIFLRRGSLEDSEREHKAAIEIATEIGDDHGVAVSLGQLGSIHLLRRDFSRAAQSHRDAIKLFEGLKEPRSVAIGYHMLGFVLYESGVFSDAENAYREAARIKDSLGDQRGAATTWMNLALCLQKQGRPAVDIEPWYRKALSAFATAGDEVSKAQVLCNLANLLAADPQQLNEARDLAAQALAVAQPLDHGAVEIWKTYGILADIAARQGDTAAARHYREAGRSAHAGAPIAREHLRQGRPLIRAVLAALRQPSQRPGLEKELSELAGRGGSNLASALLALLDGEREAASLCDPLNGKASLIVMTILRCLADPEAERSLFSDET